MKGDSSDVARAMRSLRLFGEEVLPAVREIGQELDLEGPFDSEEAVI